MDVLPGEHLVVDGETKDVAGWCTSAMRSRRLSAASQIAYGSTALDLRQAGDSAFLVEHVPDLPADLIHHPQRGQRVGDRPQR